LQDDSVLTGLSKNSGHDALAESVVQCVVDRRHGDAEARRGISVDAQVGRQTLRGQVSSDIVELRQRPQLVDDSRHPGSQLIRIRTAHHELVLSAADRGVDCQILHGLHVQRHAYNLCGLLLQAPHDVAGCGFAVVFGFQVDEETPAVERVVDPIHADEGRQPNNIGILEYDLGQRSLSVRHPCVRYALRRC
jgi:hypothetical protein